HRALAGLPAENKAATIVPIPGRSFAAAVYSHLGVHVPAGSPPSEAPLIFQVLPRLQTGGTWPPNCGMPAALGRARSPTGSPFPSSKSSANVRARPLAFSIGHAPPLPASALFQKYFGHRCASRTAPPITNPRLARRCAPASALPLCVPAVSEPAWIPRPLVARVAACTPSAHPPAVSQSCCSAFFLSACLERRRRSPPLWFRPGRARASPRQSRASWRVFSGGAFSRPFSFPRPRLLLPRDSESRFLLLSCQRAAHSASPHLPGFRLWWSPWW